MTRKYPIAVSFFIVAVLGQNIPPGLPNISGPDTIILGDTITLTCTSKGGNPIPTVSWLRDDTVIGGTTTETTNGVTTTNVTFTATLQEHLEVFECQSDNNVLQNALTVTQFIEVYFPPEKPKLNGPTYINSEDTGTWVCISANGFPASTMTMRIDNYEFSSDHFSVSTTYNVTTKSYTVTGTLNWAPSSSYDNSTIYCDVDHTQKSTVQTVNLHLSVNGSEPTLQSLITSGGLTWGEIVAIVLGILFFLFLMVLCCLLQAFCCTFCCGAGGAADDMERMVQVYAVKTVEKRPENEYEIQQYHVLRPEDFIDEKYVLGTTTQRSYYPPSNRHNSYTYYEEERRRQRWKKKKKRHVKNTGKIKHQIDDMNEQNDDDVEQRRNSENHLSRKGSHGSSTQHIILQEKIAGRADVTSLSSSS